MRRDDQVIIKIIVATEISEDAINKIAEEFAKANHIENYSVDSSIDAELIRGFVVVAHGLRYDYSVKGQLARINEHMKRNREIVPEDEIKENDISNFTGAEIHASLKKTLNEFEESPSFTICGQLLQSVEQVSEDNFITDVFESYSHVDEIGTVVSVSDGVAMVEGIYECQSTELLQFANGATGIAMNLEKDLVGVVLLNKAETVREGMVCTRTGQTVSIPVGYGMLGRVVDPLGNPIDGKGIIRFSKVRPIETPAPSVVDRSSVNEPLQTGITAIDAMTPIGKGQRELIIGDRQTGKTAIAIDTIINQRGKNVICVYVAIGQKMSNIVSTVKLLEKHRALSYTVIVAASASNSASLQYIAPYSGCAIAEEFMNQDGRDVLIVYDDLSKHAQSYRAISLLLRRPPGREAYPGDVFYLHSRLLERACKLSKEKGGGSITALPIIETQGGDISAYIPTNVISITDGQIYLESELFFSGQRPAINVGLSVSRVGGAAQTKAMKKVGGPLRISLAQAREMAAFAQFGSDLDENTRIQLKRGVVFNEVLKQPQYKPLSMDKQVVTLYLATTDKLNFLEKEDIREYIDGFIDTLRIMNPKVMKKIRREKELSQEIIESIEKVAEEYHNSYLKEHTEYRD